MQQKIDEVLEFVDLRTMLKKHLCVTYKRNIS